jgi:hypothetical protein
VSEPEPHPISLSNTEIRVAALMGADRRVSAINAARTGLAGQAAESKWHDDWIGALGELAVAKAINRYPAGIAEIPDYAGDIYPGIEVRTSARADGCLIVRPRDKPGRPYVLVLGLAPELKVAGWMLGGDAMRPRYWREGFNGRAAAYFVPATELRPITELRGWAR